MKTWMKVLMWLGLGGGIGFFAGYQVGQRGAKQNAYNAGYDQAMSERLMMQVEKAEETLKDAINEYSGGDFDGDEQLPEFTNKYISVPVAEEDPEMVEEVPVIGDEEDIEEVRQLHPQDMIPELITEDEYEANPWQYDRELMRYYGMDETLYNMATRSVIKDQDEVVGVGTLFGFYPTPDNLEGTDVLYVRNDTLGVLFKIKHLDAAYADVTSGALSPDFEEEEDETE